MSRNDPKCQHCDRDVVYVAAQLCAARYQGLRYWAKKTVTQRMKRMHQLDTMEQRLRSLNTRRR